MTSIVFLAIAVIGAAAHLLVSKKPRTPERILEVLLVWLLAVFIGVGSIVAAAAHLFFARQVAESIGWQPSPFQRENAFGDLGYGVLGVLCIWMRGNFWEATVIMSSISLIGDGYGHIYELVVNHNTAPNNTGPILYLDIIVPVLIIVLLVAYRSLQRRRGGGLAAAIVTP